MRFNTTYKQTLSLKDTVIAIDLIKNSIFNHYKHKYELINVTPPAFYEEEDEKLVELSVVTRDANIDLGDKFKVVTLSMTDSNWMRDLIDRIQLEEKKGIFAEANYIWRDIEESPVSSTIKNELAIQIKLNNDIDPEVVSKLYTQELYSLLFDISVELKDKYKVPMIYPETINYITSQMLENELPNNSFKEREISFAIEEEAFALTGAGTRLYSGKSHTYIPPQIYDVNNFHQIIMKDRVNTEALKVASVGILSDGVLLSDQLSLFGLEDYKARDFYKKWMSKENKIIEIKINLPKLAMALLGKGHIAEVQAGIVSDESETIKSRYKLEKY